MALALDSVLAFSMARAATSSTKARMSARSRSNGCGVAGGGGGGTGSATGGGAGTMTGAGGATSCGGGRVTQPPIDAQRISSGRLRSRSEFPVRIERHEHTEAGQQGHHRRTAVADEGQRHTDHGQQTADHAGVDEHVDKENGGETP